VKKDTPLSYIELSKENLIHNIKQFRNFAKKGTEFSVAIKGNAYGHGESEVASIIKEHIEYFQVNSIEELELLRKVTKKKCFVFGYVQKADIKKAVKLGCILSIFSIEQLVEVEKVISKLKIKQEVHIPVDALLGREGFLLKELPALFQEIKKCKFIQFAGMYAHFANIEDTKDFSHADKQIKEYNKALDMADKAGFKKFHSHISATSGLLVYEKGEGIHPLVRLGIGVYGMWPSKYLKAVYKNFHFKLKPVLTWKTKIGKIKVLPKGATIGYGLTYKTTKPTKVAIIPQGYADGLDRGFSNNGSVLVHGTRCRILGRVHMNMSAIDVNHLKNVKLEDEVVILGLQGKEEITAEEMARRVGTINYEITTRISPLLPRIIA
jgi:alanine racemase